MLVFKLKSYLKHWNQQLLVLKARNSMGSLYVIQGLNQTYLDKYVYFIQFKFHQEFSQLLLPPTKKVILGVLELPCKLCRMVSWIEINTFYSIKTGSTEVVCHWPPFFLTHSYFFNIRGHTQNVSRQPCQSSWNGSQAQCGLKNTISGGLKVTCSRYMTTS